jgi:hypothetical protein
VLPWQAHGGEFANFIVLHVCCRNYIRLCTCTDIHSCACVDTLIHAYIYLRCYKVKSLILAEYGKYESQDGLIFLDCSPSVFSL